MIKKKVKEFSKEYKNELFSYLTFILVVLFVIAPIIYVVSSLALLFGANETVFLSLVTTTFLGIVFYEGLALCIGTKKAYDMMLDKAKKKNRKKPEWKIKLVLGIIDAAMIIYFGALTKVSFCLINESIEAAGGIFFIIFISVFANCMFAICFDEE